MVKKKKINDVSVEPNEMNEAMKKHFLTKEKVAIIAENTCIRNGQPCVYAQHLKKGIQAPVENCEFKNFFDDFLYDSLKSGLILTLEINDCIHYEPDMSVETMANKMQPISIMG